MQSSKNIWRKVLYVIQPRRFSLKRTLLEIVGFAITLQAIVVIILEVISLIRRQNRHQGPFPHLSPEEVIIGKNTVQIYDYGHDLYASMLQAIDAAQ